MDTILIKNATIITQNSKREILKGDILIDEGKIKKVEKNIEEKADKVIDGKEKIVLPGFINTHVHVAMTLFRGFGENLSLHDWLTKKIWPAENKLTEEAIYYGSLLGIAEMIRSGTIAFNDMYLKSWAIAEAVHKSKIKAVIGIGLNDLGGAKINFDDFEKLESKVKSLNSKKIKTSVCCHAVYSCSEELLKTAKDIARKNKKIFHIHANETRKEIFNTLKKKGKRPIEYFDDIGILDEYSILAHAVYVSENEIKIMAKRNVSVAHCPVSNLKLATGAVSPITEMISKGINVTIGTDGAASNNSLNIIESMKVASLLQKNTYWKAENAPPQQMLDLVTVNSAKALKLNNGSIEVGKDADIIIIDGNAPNLNPSYDYVANIIYSLNPSNIEMVIVDGEILYENGKIKSFNEYEVIEKIRKIKEEIATSY